MDNFGPVFATLMFAISGALLMILFVGTFSEVDGTVRDKYVSHGDSYLVVDYSTGETNRWSVLDEPYKSCDIGDNIHRSEDGSISCK